MSEEETPPEIPAPTPTPEPSNEEDAALEKEIEAAPEEEKKIFVAGMGKTTPADRQWIRDEVAEGRMKPSACAAKYGVSVQYVSKLLRQAGITYGSRKKEREEAEKAAIAAKEAEAKATFADRRLRFIEEHKMSAYAQLRAAFQMEGQRQKRWRDGLLAGGAPPTPKDANASARTMAVLDERIRILLGIDEIIDEKELPQIDVRYMGDEEIIAARKGAQSTDETLPTLDNNIIEESP